MMIINTGTALALAPHVIANASWHEQYFDIDRLEVNDLAMQRSVSNETSNNRLVPGEADRFTASLGLRRCNYDDTQAYDNLDGDGIVAPRAFSCIRWNLGDNGTAYATSGYSDVAQVDSPVVTFSPRSNYEAGIHKFIVLEVVGGPGGDIAPGVNNALALSIVSRGGTVVRLGYTGTMHRSLYPNPDFDEAVSEVVKYVSFLHSHNAHVPIILMGESLGGIIAADAASKMSPSTVKGLFLVHPLAYSPQEAINNFRNKLGVNPSTDSLLPIWNLFEKSDNLSSGHYEYVQSLRLFDKFFDKTESNVNLYKILDHSDIDVEIFYNRGDVRVGVDKIIHLASIKKVSLNGFNGSGHFVDEVMAREIADKLVHYLSVETAQKPIRLPGSSVGGWDVQSYKIKCRVRFCLGKNIDVSLAQSSFEREG